MPIRIAHLNSPQLKRWYVYDAEAALGSDDRTGAIAALEKALRFAPWDDDVPMTASMLYFQQDQPARAAYLAVAALRARRFHPNAMNFLGVLCLESGLPRLARRILGRTVQLAPGLASARRNLAAAKADLRNASKDAPEETEGQFLSDGDVRDLIGPSPIRLSACVMRRKDRAPIDDCIAKLAPHVDEIVVVDVSGGVRPSAPTENIPFTLVDAPRGAVDRAGAWNAGLDRCNGDWVLTVHADEDFDAAELCKAIDAPARTLFRNVTLEYPDGTTRLAPRLFRRAAGVRYEGTHLARVLPSLRRLAHQWGLEESRCDARIQIAGDDKSGSARERRLSRLDMEVEAEGTRIVERIEAAELEVRLGQTERARRRVDRARELLYGQPAKPTDADIERLVVVEGLVMMRQGRAGELADLCSAHHRSHPATHNTLFLEGVAAKGLGNDSLAVERLRKAASLRHHPAWSPALDEVSGSGLHNLLGALLIDSRDLDAAGEAFRKALEIEPGNLEAELGLLVIERAAGEIETLLRKMEQLVDDHAESLQLWTAGSAVLSSLPQIAQAEVDWLKAACEKFPAEPELMERLGAAELRAGNPDAALQAWNGLSYQGDAGLASRIAASLASGSDVPPVNGANSQQLHGCLLQWFESWMLSGAIKSLDKALVDLHRAEPALPGLAECTSQWLDRVGQQEAASRLRKSVSNAG